MSQLERFENRHSPSHVCWLRKSLYSLKQAPRAWYTKLRVALQSWGFVRSVSDASLFIKRTSKFVLFVLIYVDDILVIGSDSQAVSDFIHDLDKNLALKTWIQCIIFLDLKLIELRLEFISLNPDMLRIY